MEFFAVASGIDDNSLGLAKIPAFAGKIPNKIGVEIR